MIRIFTSKNQKTGLKGEDIAVVFLMKHGFKIVDRNFHSRNGEIDIIAKKSKIYHFFEVKTGQQGSWFNPAENLTKEKLWRFYRAVQYYALIKRIKQYKVQGILVFFGEGEPKVEIIELT
ncbi:MAG TPA: YraN family protein [Candidatus Paceibacterota bacterium]|jgi:putative endonuclease|nr:YraN family protein [Candidatus Paceibacterota bacterium]